MTRRDRFLWDIESTLNNAYCAYEYREEDADFTWDERHEPGQCCQNPGAKKPQLPEDHAQVVPGPAQDRVQRIAQAPLEPIPAQ